MAIEHIKDRNMTFAQASKEYGVPPRTLRRHFNKQMGTDKEKMDME